MGMLRLPVMTRPRNVKLAEICARLTVARTEIAHILEVSCQRPDLGDEPHSSTEALIDIALLSVDAAIEALNEVASADRLRASDLFTGGRLT